MLSITNLTETSRNFILSLANSGNSRSKIVTMCLAKAIADQLPITTAQEGDIKSMYRNLFEIEVMKQISDINELCIIDTESIKLYVRAFYVWRYRIAFDPYVALCTNQDTAIVDFFGIKEALDVDAIDVLKNDPIGATKYYNGFMSFLREIKKAA
jgi:hypothetical protein